MVFTKNWVRGVGGGVEIVNFNINMKHKKTLENLKYTQFKNKAYFWNGRSVLQNVACLGSAY